MKFSHVSAWSFGKGVKNNLEKTDRIFTPGPGSYESTLSNKRASPHWKMGSASRSQSARNFNPGPGQYDYSKYLGKAPKYSMGLKTSYFDPTMTVVSPGPGNYNPNHKTFFRNISYTMSSKLNQSKSDNNPGPGNYEVRSDKTLLVPSYKFGFEKKCLAENTTNKHTPGPGNYETRKNLGDDAPKISMGKEKRDNERRPMTPGPGQYQTKQYIGNDGPKIHISSVRPQTSSSSKFVPGPGQYDMSLSNRPKSPSFKIGTSKRDGLRSSGVPGPGQYEFNNSLNLSMRPKSPVWSLGTSTRQPLSTSEMSPGPGNYNISNTVGKGPKYSITGKNFYNGNRSSIPGPGQYNNDTKTHMYKNPSWKIGTSNRDDDLKRVKRQNIPGPGQYDINLKSGQSFKFGSEKRDKRADNFTPGPGQYHIPCSIVDVPKYLMSAGSFNPQFRYI